MNTEYRTRNNEFRMQNTKLHFDFGLFFLAVSILFTKIEISSLHSEIAASTISSFQVKGTLLIIFNDTNVSRNSFNNIFSLWT